MCPMPVSPALATLLALWSAGPAPVLAGTDRTVSSASPAADQSLSCALTTRPIGSGLTEIAALVWTDRDRLGDYRIEVLSQGRGGRSVVQQGGHFTAAAGAQSVLGLVRLGQGSDLSGLEISARLVVATDDGLECLAEW